MDKDKDISYTSMDDLTPKRPTRESDPSERPPGNAYPADPPESQGGGGTVPSVTEDPLYRPRPSDPPSDEDDTTD